MAKTPHVFLLSSLLLVPSLVQGVLAVQYSVTNNVPDTPGGKRFDEEIGASFATDLMGTITKFIWTTFNQNSDADRKDVPAVNLIVKNLDDGALGEIGENNVYIDAKGIASFPPGGARHEFTWLMYHEMTHIFQWSGKGTAPGGLTEGIADYVMIKSGTADEEGYTKPGEGSKWDEGYGVTERFLEYCDSLREGFTATLNNKMREVYKDEYFQDLLGKPLDQVWREYKAKYGNTPASIASEVLLTDRVKY